MMNSLKSQRVDGASDGMLPTTSCSLPSSSGISPLLDRVICGDNCETLATMPSESVDLVVTSPPYDNLRTYGGHSWDFLRLADELTRVLKPGGVIVWVVADAKIKGSETLTSMRQAIHFKDACGLNVIDTMIYDKGFAKFPQVTTYGQSWEYMFVICKGSPKTFNKLKEPANGYKSRRRSDRGVDGKTRTKEIQMAQEKSRRNVWQIDSGYLRSSKDRFAFDHPAIFPETLALDHIKSWSNPGDVVLDPFAGSGTTLKAARELGRQFVGIEINPEYVEICKRRVDEAVLNLL